MEGTAKLFVLLILIALFIQLVKHGPAGPRMWVNAKLLGQVNG
jgi:hypothetical protein